MSSRLMVPFLRSQAPCNRSIGTCMLALRNTRSIIIKQSSSDSRTIRKESNQKEAGVDDPEPVDATKNEQLDVLLKSKEEMLQQRDKEICDLKDKYLRCLAEIENTRSRMSRLVEDAKKFGIQGFSKDIIEVADILEKAMESVPEDELKNDANPHLSSLFAGLSMTKTELQKSFGKNGLERIYPLGEVFDPAVHEALFEVCGDKPGTIGVVSKVGYLLNGRTIRPALVGVVKKS